MMSQAPRLWVRGWNTAVTKVRVSFESTHLWTADNIDHLEGAVNAFVSLGERGGFALEAARSVSSRMAHLSASQQAVGMVFELQVKLVDGRAFQLLRNMVYALRVEGVTVGDIRVEAAGVHANAWLSIPLPNDSNVDESYPLGPLEPAFEVVRDSDGSTRARRCLVEHTESVPPGQVLRIAAWIDPWFEVVERGGFALPDYVPGEVGSLRSGIAQFDECSTEVALLRYSGSEALWPVLLNLMVDYHTTERALGCVTIE